MKCHFVFGAGLVDNERYTAGSSKGRSKTGRGSDASSDQGGFVRRRTVRPTTAENTRDGWEKGMGN